MEDREWDLIEGVLEECWPGQWTERTGPAYRLLLDGYPAEVVVASLRKYAAVGSKFRPSASELVGGLTEDPGVPTWTEVEEALLGRAGILRNGRELPGESHEYLVAFVAATGRERLGQRPFDDPEWGEVERRRLREDWERFAERAEERRAHGSALASIGAPSGELTRLRPLAALGIDGRLALPEAADDPVERAS